MKEIKLVQNTDTATTKHNQHTVNVNVNRGFI